MAVRAVRHAGIVVRDAEASLRFYRDLLGLSVQNDQVESGPFIEGLLDIPGVRVRTVKLGAREGVALVELLHFHSPAPTGAVPGLTQLGPTHVALTVDNLDLLHARLTDAGVKFMSEPADSPDGKARVAFCADPDGVRLELVQVLAPAA
jgi:catechol 2,3-dioxygenase-like lactoylglutathione lyase family enzyme